MEKWGFRSILRLFPGNIIGSLSVVHWRFTGNSGKLLVNRAFREIPFYLDFLLTSDWIAIRSCSFEAGHASFIRFRMIFITLFRVFHTYARKSAWNRPSGITRVYSLRVDLCEANYYRKVIERLEKVLKEVELVVSSVLMHTRKDKL